MPTRSRTKALRRHSEAMRAKGSELAKAVHALAVAGSEAEADLWHRASTLAADFERISHPSGEQGEEDFCERCNGSFGEAGCQFCNPAGHAPREEEIPADYWREVPCGHPDDPVAMYNREGWPVCHCGCLLDTAGRHLLPAPPEAPGPLSHCQKCGCHVAIPPPTRPPATDPSKEER